MSDPAPYDPWQPAGMWTSRGWYTFPRCPPGYRWGQPSCWSAATCIPVGCNSISGQGCRPTVEPLGTGPEPSDKGPLRTGGRALLYVGGAAVAIGALWWLTK